MIWASDKLVSVQLMSGGFGKREIENNQRGEGTAVEIGWKHAKSW